MKSLLFSVFFGFLFFSPVVRAQEALPDEADDKISKTPDEAESKISKTPDEAESKISETPDAEAGSLAPLPQKQETKKVLTSNVIPFVGIRVWDVDWRPTFSFKFGLVVWDHPRDTMVGAQVGLSYHLKKTWAVGAEFRHSDGTDSDRDRYAHKARFFGGTVTYYFFGELFGLSFQPFARLAAGYSSFSDEKFQEPKEENTKSRNFKENGVPASGFSSFYTEEVLGAQFVLYSESGESSVGISVDIDAGAGQDWKFGIGETFFKFGLSLIISY